MKKLLLIILVAGGFALGSVSRAEAGGVSVGIGIGVPVGYQYPYYGCYPRYYPYAYYPPYSYYRRAVYAGPRWYWHRGHRVYYSRSYHRPHYRR